MKDRFVNIQEWMLQLGLSTNELIAFAIVYGFSQDGKSTFKGGLDYISTWICKNRITACRVMNGLVEKGIIEKIEHFSGAVKVCEYRIPKAILHNKNYNGDYKNYNGSHNKNYNGAIINSITRKETNKSKEVKADNEPIANNSLNDIMSRYGS